MIRIELPDQLENSVLPMSHMIPTAAQAADAAS